MLSWQNNGLDSQSTTDTSVEPPVGVFFAYVAPLIANNIGSRLSWHLLYRLCISCTLLYFPYYLIVNSI
ncbi:hypothetical protein Hanom_Chr05g00454451 [Helianthus anomalus]